MGALSRVEGGKSKGGSGRSRGFGIKSKNGKREGPFPLHFFSKGNTLSKFGEGKEQSMEKVLSIWGSYRCTWSEQREMGLKNSWLVRTWRKGSLEAKQISAWGENNLVSFMDALDMQMLHGFIFYVCCGCLILGWFWSRMGVSDLLLMCE